MATVADNFSLPDIRLLAAAPHRLMFFIGACNVLMAILWWTLWLLDARFQWLGLAQPARPAGWMHAIVMQYQVLPPFMFGFLLTVFPKWMNLPALTRCCCCCCLPLLGRLGIPLSAASNPRLSYCSCLSRMLPYPELLLLLLATLFLGLELAGSGGGE